MARMSRILTEIYTVKNSPEMSALRAQQKKLVRELDEINRKLAEEEKKLMNVDKRRKEYYNKTELLLEDLNNLENMVLFGEHAENEIFLGECASDIFKLFQQEYNTAPNLVILGWIEDQGFCQGNCNYVFDTNIYKLTETEGKEKYRKFFPNTTRAIALRYGDIEKPSFLHYEETTTDIKYTVIIVNKEAKDTISGFNVEFFPKESYTELIANLTGKEYKIYDYTYFTRKITMLPIERSYNSSEIYSVLLTPFDCICLYGPRFSL